jgi:tRNA modification GTPase
MVSISVDPPEVAAAFRAGLGARWTFLCDVERVVQEELGLRETTDTVERLGIEVSEEYLARSDVVVACGDDVQTLARALDAVARRTTAPVLPVRTKTDRVEGRGWRDDEVRGAIGVSAETGEGLGELVSAIIDLLETGERMPPSFDAPLLTHTRHRIAVQQARDEVAAFRTAWSEADLPAPVAAVHLRAAVHALEELIGAVDVEEVLGRVFSSFCVGK